jgi:hypothetical protein
MKSHILPIMQAIEQENPDPSKEKSKPVVAAEHSSFMPGWSRMRKP